MKKEKGQILLITLLVMTILAIIIVSIVVLVSRDVKQVVYTEKYQEAYNVAESQLSKLLNKYAKYNQPLSTITTDFGSWQLQCTVDVPPDSYICHSTENTLFSDASLTTDITVKDEKDITGITVYKDRSYDVDIRGYANSVDVYWDNSAAMDFSIIYIDSAGEYRSIHDVYDLSNIFTSTGSDNPNNDTTNRHPINFVVNGGNVATSTRFNIPATVGLPAGSTLLTLRITPRMGNTGPQSIQLTVRALLPGSFPYQIRHFISQVYDGSDPTNPAALIETKVPLYPQADNSMDNSIIVEGVLK